MSVTAFLATKACFGACVALYNLVEGDAPDAFEGFGIATGSVFAHYWTKRGQAASVETMCKLLERDLQTHLDAEGVEDVPAILADLHEFGPKFIGSAKALTVEELVQEANGRPDALTGIVLDRARAALPEDKEGWSDWQHDFADAHSNRHVALRFLLVCIHDKLYGLQSSFEQLVVEQLAQAHEKLNRVDDRQEALHKWLTEEQYTKALEIEGLKDQLAAANAQIEEMAAREANQPGLAAEALAEHDSDKGYDALVAEADTILAESSKAAAATLRNAGAIAFLNNTQDALVAYRRATELDPDDIGGWNQLGHLLVRVGAYDDAENAYKKTGELAQLQGNASAEGSSFGNLGALFLERGNTEQAVEAIEQALILDSAIGYKQGMASHYGNLGNLYRALGDLAKAENAYDQCLLLSRQIDFKHGMANCYGSLGNLSENTGDTDKATFYYEKAAEVFQTLGDEEGQATVLGNLGIIYLGRNEPERARAAYEQSLALFRRLDHKRGVANQYVNLAGMYRACGDQDQACKFLCEAKDLYREIDIQHMVEQVHNWMREAGCSNGEGAH